MEMVSRDGMTYFVPASEKDVKINGIRRWEQAFWVYAAIYCKENLLRSAEIWQYIYVINTAASTYQWEDVAWYDYTFRQVMSLNPQRSWGKTYGQLWNLAMVNPIQRQTGQSHGQSGNNWNSTRKTPHQNGKKKGETKPFEKKTEGRKKVKKNKNTRKKKLRAKDEAAGDYSTSFDPNWACNRNQARNYCFGSGFAGHDVSNMSGADLGATPQFHAVLDI